MTPPQDKIKSLVEFLESQKIASLATVSKDGNPHSTTIYYYADQKLNIYFVTRKETKKYENLQVNSKVALNISNIHKLMTVQIQGHAELIKNAEELITAVGRLKTIQFGDRSVENPPLTKIEGDFVLYKISPSHLKWLNYEDWYNTTVLELNEFDDIFGDKTLG